MAKNRETAPRKRGRPRKSALVESAPMTQPTEQVTAPQTMEEAASSSVQDNAIKVAVGSGYLIIAGATPSAVCQVLSGLAQEPIPENVLHTLASAVCGSETVKALRPFCGSISARYCAETGKKIEICEDPQALIVELGKVLAAPSGQSLRPGEPIVAAPVFQPAETEDSSVEEVEAAVPFASFEDEALEEDEEDYPQPETAEDDYSEDVVEEEEPAAREVVEDEEVDYEEFQPQEGSSEDQEVVSVDLESMSKEELLDFCRQYHIPVESDWSREQICNYLLQNYVE